MKKVHIPLTHHIIYCLKWFILSVLNRESKGLLSTTLIEHPIFLHIHPTAKEIPSETDTNEAYM